MLHVERFHLLNHHRQQQPYRHTLAVFPELLEYAPLHYVQG